jgi:putative selenium metabolism hydrolase
MEQSDTVAALCRRLVRIPSLSGQERLMAATVAEAMAELGFAEIYADAYGSVVGQRTGRAPGPTVLYDAHIDTVAPASPDNWTRDPWSGEIADGRLWGLGAADVKGGLAAMLVGLARLPRDAFEGQLIVSASVCEENVTGAALGHILDRHAADVVVIAEPTELRLGIAQKGRLDLLLRAAGRSAHTSQPELGDNAVYRMLDAVQRVRGLPLPVDPALGREVLELVEIVSDPFPGTAHVPHGCRARFLARTLPGENAESALARLRAALAGLDRVDVSLEQTSQACYTGAVLVHDGDLPGWRSANDAPWLTRMQAALRGVSQPGATFAAPFGCNASTSAGRRRVPTVIYGPGSLAQAHVVDEWISLDQLSAATSGYAALALGCLA